MTPNQKQFIYWIKERESIRFKKGKGDPHPWSDNPVMQETYFCNIDREDDKVTRWIRNNWDCTPENVNEFHIHMIIARVFNQPNTLQAIGEPWDKNLGSWLQEAHALLKRWEAKKAKIWNGAYIISTAGKKMSKLDYCFDMFIHAHSLPDLLDGVTTLKLAHSRLMQVNGLASFLAAQVVADLKRYDEHPLYWADDWFSFSAPGPGSLRGLGWFWDTKVTNASYEELIQTAYAQVKHHLPDSIIKKLDMQNFQNCFCEYDKFMRVTNKTGRSKRKYKYESNRSS